MARSTSHGPRQATNWTATQTPRPIPRLVRVGRPANDNVRRWRLPAALLPVIAAALVVAVIYAW